MKYINVLPMLFTFAGIFLITACNNQVEIPTSTATVTFQPTDTATPTKTRRPTRTPTPLPEGVEWIEMKTSDGIDLVGYLHKPESLADERLAVVFANSRGGSPSEWKKLEGLLNENGFTTMTFDFRGKGASGGVEQFATIGDDVKTVIDYLTRQGFERIVCIGASMGGTACLNVSIGFEISGLVMLSSPINIPIGPRITNVSDVKNLTIPKIIMFTEEDVAGQEFVDSLYDLAENAAKPKSIYIYPGTSHGADLFYTEFGEEILEILFNFVKGLANY